MGAQEFKKGDRVRRLNDIPFSNGEKVLTVRRVDERNRVWLEETDTWIDGRYLELETPLSTKVTYEFDKVPALLFVQHDAGHNWEILVDGKPLHGVQEVTITATFDGITTHTIRYVTGATKNAK